MSLSTKERRRKIKDLIESKKISFDFLYSAAGIPASTYNKWKAGVSAPSEAFLLKLEKFINDPDKYQKMATMPIARSSKYRITMGGVQDGQSSGPNGSRKR